MFSGVFSVLPTPFDPAGELDPDSLKGVIDLFLHDGVNGFTALGVTGEVARLSISVSSRWGCPPSQLPRRVRRSSRRDNQRAEAGGPQRQ